MALRGALILAFLSIASFIASFIFDHF
jgi:hypothetical protein